MHHTFFDTPVVNILLRGVAFLWLRMTGWKVEGSLPPEAAKAVVIAAPHTSNWDLPYMLVCAFALRMDIYWMGKKSIFKFPFKTLMLWMGGIPVDRAKASNLVAASAEALTTAQGPLQLVVPPEATRAKTRVWKTGFYYIAVAAKVPILMTYLDYSRKTGGIGPLFWPTGDIEKDMPAIRAFYAPFKGKYPDQFHAAEDE